MLEEKLPEQKAENYLRVEELNSIISNHLKKLLIGSRKPNNGILLKQTKPFVQNLKTVSPLDLPHLFPTTCNIFSPPPICAKSYYNIIKNMRYDHCL